MTHWVDKDFHPQNHKLVNYLNLTTIALVIQNWNIEGALYAPLSGNWGWKTLKY